MTGKHFLILNQHQIQQKIDRIAYQILEDNFDEEEIVIAGILPSGDKIARRLKKVILDEIAPLKVSLSALNLISKAPS